MNTPTYPRDEIQKAFLTHDRDPSASHWQKALMTLWFKSDGIRKNKILWTFREEIHEIMEWRKGR